MPTEADRSRAPPTPESSAWIRLYGTCRDLAEWASEENLDLALNGRTQRIDDQTKNIASIKAAFEVLSTVVKKLP